MPDVLFTGLVGASATGVSWVALRSARRIVGPLGLTLSLTLLLIGAAELAVAALLIALDGWSLYAWVTLVVGGMIFMSSELVRGERA